MPVDTTADSSHCTHPIICGNNNKDNMKNGSNFIDTFNTACNLVNGKKYYIKKLWKIIHMILHDIGIMIDQPGERSHTNFAGGNSDYRDKFGHSCNFKDIHEILTSCEE